MAAPDDLCEDFLKSFPNGFHDKYAAIGGLSTSGKKTLIFAYDHGTKNNVVLKLYRQILGEHRNALCALRNVKYLAQLFHPHVVKMFNICGKRKLMFSDLFIEMEVMGVDLAKLLVSYKHIFTDNALLKSRCMLHILSGLAYIHSAQIVHRNLHPGHILFNPNGQIFKIATFSHARKIGVDESEGVTRNPSKSPFNAPEVVLCPERLSSAMDIYAAGLILIQVLGVNSKPFLEGRPGMQHIQQILEKTGKPRAEDLVDLRTDQVHYILQRLSPDAPHRTWMEIYPEYSINATDLMEGMLHFSSPFRYTAIQALEQDYFTACRNADPVPIPLKYEDQPLLDYPATLSFPRLLQELNASITKDLSTVHDNDQLQPFNLH